MAPKILHVWTIYHGLSEYPGRWVVWRTEITPGRVTPTLDASMHGSLDEARAAVPPGRMVLPRSPEEDPTIVESWI